ncbi:uncharacterized protein [Chironomus tepperi]|uniref:uncharacterized protein n=1 Tax=Chironomus tepperi TaxID=113505 RepID=UPI00391F7787
MDAVDFTKEIPSWLNQDLFDKAIQNYEADPQAKVNSFELVPALQPGQNMASAVFRAAIKFTSKYSKDVKELSVIVKTQPVTVDLPIMAHLKDTTLFETEIGVYTNILGRVQELITSVGYKDVMGPKLIYQTMTPKPVIILEDVSVNGFDTVIMKIHEDFELSKLIVKYLAKFHAASFYLQDEQKIDASYFNSTIFQFSDMAKLISMSSYEYLTTVMPEWDGFEKLVEPVKHFKDVFLEKNMKTYTPNSGPGAWNVLNHGDFLMKNLMYKMRKEGEGFEDFMMLDFQICTYASPAIDLIYTLYNFVSDEDRIARYDEFLYTYHEQYVEALKKFGYLKQPPSLLDLQVEMMKNGNFQAHYVLMPYAFLIFDMTSLTLEDMADGMKGMAIKVYNNERFRKTAKKELDYYLMKGYLGN